ncbi:MAG: hypothetical protein EOR12_30920 [Mesorhizobium sp.]|nr:MAG: hypothetical protein EOR12_30920 [Mesorhizobium sp.]
MLEKSCRWLGGEADEAVVGATSVRCDRAELLMLAGQHPPLSCRTSPPQVGRLAVSASALFSLTVEMGRKRS